MSDSIAASDVCSTNDPPGGPRADAAVAAASAPATAVAPRSEKEALKARMTALSTELLLLKKKAATIAASSSSQRTAPNPSAPAGNRRLATSAAKSLLKTYVPTAPVAVVGSVASGLALDASDVDLVACLAGVRSAATFPCLLGDEPLGDPLLYHWVERPFRAWRPVPKRRVPLVLLPVFVSLVLLIVLLQGPLYGSLYPSAREVSASASPPTPTPPTQNAPHSSCACSNAHGALGKTLHSPPGLDPHSPLPCFDADGLPVNGDDHSRWIYEQRCCQEPWHNPLTSVDGPMTFWEVQDTASACLTPDRGASDQPTLFLIGDSHAAMLTEGIRKALAGRMTLAWTARGMCPPLPPALYGWCDQDSLETATLYQRHLVTTLTSQLRSGDVAAVASWWAPWRDASQARLVADHYRNTLVPLVSSKGAQLLLFGDVFGGLPKVPLSCLNHATSPSCQRSYTDAARQFGGAASSREASALADGNEHTRFFDLAPLFCTSTAPDGVCNTMVPGTDVVAFADSHHLSRAGSAYLAPYLCSQFERWGFFGSTLAGSGSDEWASSGGALHQALNRRWAQGKPSNDWTAAGVLVHVFDGDGIDLVPGGFVHGAPKLDDPLRGLVRPSGGHLAASLLNARHPTPFRCLLACPPQWRELPGIVLKPSAQVISRLSCLAWRDIYSIQYNRPNVTHAGCPARSSWCDRRGGVSAQGPGCTPLGMAAQMAHCCTTFPPTQLDKMMTMQDLYAWPRGPCLGNCTDHKNPAAWLFDEIILDTEESPWEPELEAMIGAVFISPTASSQSFAWGRAAHAALLQRLNVSADALPFLYYNMLAPKEPFSVVPSNDRQ